MISPKRKYTTKSDNKFVKFSGMEMIDIKKYWEGEAERKWDYNIFYPLIMNDSGGMKNSLRSWSKNHNSTKEIR